MPSPQPAVTPFIPQQVGLGIMMATAFRALTTGLIPPARTNAISVITVLPLENFLLTVIVV